MEEAIQAQTRDRVPEEVTELVLDTCKAAKVTGLEKFSNLKLLTLNGCGLTSLEGFPTLPKLQRLELSDNGLSDGLDALQDACLVGLKCLSLAGNKFNTLDTLEPLVPPSPRISPRPSLARHASRAAPRVQAALPNLRDLDLYNCAVTELTDYRASLFNMLPVLKYLDGFDADDNEKDDDDDIDDEDDEDDEEDDDLLDSEDGGQGYDDSDVIESEDDDEIGEEEFDEGEEEYDDDLGGEEGEEGLSGLEGEEGTEGEDFDGDEDDESQSEGGDAKRQRR